MSEHPDRARLGSPTVSPDTPGPPADAPLRVALVHDFLVHMRGAERFLVVLSEVFPTADIYLLVCNPEVIPAAWRGRPLYTSFVDRLPFARHSFRAGLFLYPYAIQRFDFTNYDLVISSSMGFAHGVVTQPTTCHICCDHTPFRYAWSWYHQHLGARREPMALLSQALLERIRHWEREAADRVDYFVANSRLTQQRIQKFYRRSAEVIPYPIDLSAFAPSDCHGESYLIVSALMPYKRIDVAVAAFTKLGLPLQIIGEGPEYRRLKAMAGPTVELRGALTDREVREAYARCRAFIMTAEEDYGLTPLEAQASGRPVIAYGRGGALETVVDGVTGVFYPEQTAESLMQAIAAFDPARFDARLVREHAMQFDLSVFRERFLTFVWEKLAEYRRAYGLPAVTGSRDERLALV